MKRRLTFSTHAFARRVLTCPINWSCCELVEMLYDRDPGGLCALGQRHVAGWVRKQYLDEEVRRFDADDRGGHMLVLKFDSDGSFARHARRKAMAERLLAKPDRRTSVTVDL